MTRLLCYISQDDSNILPELRRELQVEFDGNFSGASGLGCTEQHKHIYNRKGELL
jgi:hypothetical protein